MRMNRNVILGIIIAATILVIAGGAYWFKKTNEAGIIADGGATTTPNVIDNGNYKIEVLSDTATFDSILPDLNRTTQYGASVPEAVKLSVESKIGDIISRLKEDNTRADDWFMLAVLYHGVNDYEGAEGVWNFLLKVIKAPDVAVVYDNLGKMYKFEKKDYAKAEAYFKESIQANPESETPYLELFEMYRYSYKTGTSAAVDIANEAGKKFPDSPDPYTLLGAYYRDLKQYDNARSAYEVALSRARATGNYDIVNSINAALDSLPK